MVTARRPNEQRSAIETQTGASTYTIDSEALAAMPGGDNVQLNQVLLQAPDVVQDSFGQLHVRADHNDLQYRLRPDHPRHQHFVHSHWGEVGARVVMKSIVLLMLSLFTATLVLRTGRTMILHGVVLLVLFIVYLFLTVVP